MNFLEGDLVSLKEFIIPIITGIFTWFLARHKNKAEIIKIQAEAKKLESEAYTSIQGSDTSKFLAIINAQEIRITELRQEISELRKEIREVRHNYEEKITQLWDIIIKLNPDIQDIEVKDIKVFLDKF